MSSLTRTIQKRVFKKMGVERPSKVVDGHVVNLPWPRLAPPMLEA